ncbi:MAG: GNAT family N-acetyltransferase [Bacillota bacterium]
MQIKEIENNKLKQSITEKILRDLPEWFGIEEATKEYINTVKNYPFIACYKNDEAIGFYSLREENKNVLDMYVLGVLKKYHHKGIGKALQEFAEKYAREKGYKYLMVLTLAKKANNKAYLDTREFYLRMGYIDFYQNDEIFSPEDPCQIMIKCL